MKKVYSMYANWIEVNTINVQGVMNIMLMVERVVSESTIVFNFWIYIFFFGGGGLTKKNISFIAVIGVCIVIISFSEHNRLMSIYFLPVRFFPIYEENFLPSETLLTKISKFTFIGKQLDGFEISWLA